VFSSVLVGTDGSDRAERAVHAAVDVAKALSARLVLVAAFREGGHSEMIPGGASTTKGDMRTVAEQMLIRSARHAEREGLTDVDWEARQGHPADVIIDLAIERGADLIVVGNKGMTGARRYVLGGVADKISHHAPCSVMIVRTD
jgi:nucleotide-binding universal stress UspA family protein